MDQVPHTKPEWNTEDRRFECVQNAFGQWWPKMYVRTAGVSGPTWCQIIIRDSNPFKTLAGAEKFIEKTIARISKKQVNSEVV